MKLILTVCAVLLSLATPAWGQGNWCYSAESISGLGDFSFDTSSGVTTNFGSGGPCANGPRLTYEGFFQWTASTNGDYRFMVPTSFSQGHLALYEGTGCQAQCAARGTFYTEGSQQFAYVDLPQVQSGDTYLVQLGNRSGTGGPGVLQVRQQACGPSTTTDDPFEPNDTCATAQPILPGTYPDLWIWPNNPDFYTIDVPGLHRLTLRTPSSQGASVVHIGSPCPLPSGSGQWSWVNQTDQSVRMTFSVEMPWPTGLETCRNYELTASVRFEPCIVQGETQIGAGHVSEGFYPSLPAAQWGFMKFCVGQGATLTLDLGLVRQDGILRAGLCDSTDCILGTRFVEQQGQNVTLQWVNNTGADREIGLLSDYLGGPPYCNKIDLNVSISNPCDSQLVTQEFCEPGSVHSGGLSTHLMAVERNESWPSLQLHCVRGPAQAFGFVIVGTASNAPGVALGNGTLCLDQAPGRLFGRYNQAGSPLNSIGQFDSFGRFQSLNTPQDFGYSVPLQLPWGSPIQSGQTLYFQLWHRDEAGSSNLSNGVQVTF